MLYPGTKSVSDITILFSVGVYTKRQRAREGEKQIEKYIKRNREIKRN